MDLYNLYDELYKLTKKQSELINDDDYKKLLEVIEKKQEIIELIEKKEMIEYINSQDKSKKKFAELKSLMKKINDLEVINHEKIKKSKNNLINRIKDITLKTKSNNGYKKQREYEAKFIDKKG